jgi:hypothetical protein
METVNNSAAIPLPLLLAGVLLAVVIVLWLVRRGRTTPNAGRSQPAVRPAAAAPVSPVPPAEPPADQTWAPPSYSAASSAIAGPSLRIGIGFMRVHEGNLLVSWNALNDGSEPLAVQWDAPQVQPAGGDALVLSYTTNTDAESFAVPETRTCQPGDILSRSASIPLAALGRDLAGLRVTVAVGYGPADGVTDAAVSPAAYADWQKTALSAPRAAPRQ